MDEFVAMVEHAQKFNWEGETNNTPAYKQKQEEEEMDLDHSPTFKYEMKSVDENMHSAPPRASQRSTSCSAPLEI